MSRGVLSIFYDECPLEGSLLKALVGVVQRSGGLRVAQMLFSIRLAIEKKGGSQ